jgi:hypothetical protein
MIRVQAEDKKPSPKIADLREKIDSKEYMCEAIQRIALVLSNEIMDISRGGMGHERKGRE